MTRRRRIRTVCLSFTTLTRTSATTSTAPTSRCVCVAVSAGVCMCVCVCVCVSSWKNKTAATHTHAAFFWVSQEQKSCDALTHACTRLARRRARTHTHLEFGTAIVWSASDGFRLAVQVAFDFAIVGVRAGYFALFSE